MDFNQLVILWVTLKCSRMLKFRKLQIFFFLLPSRYRSQILSWTSSSLGYLIDVAALLIDRGNEVTKLLYYHLLLDETCEAPWGNHGNRLQVFQNLALCTKQSQNANFLHFSASHLISRNSTVVSGVFLTSERQSLKI